MAENLVTVNLRLSSELLRKIDDVVDIREPKVPRHTWIVEAIYEHLRREVREGTLEIFWVNSNESSEPPKYRLIFCRYTTWDNGGAMQPYWIIGDNGLLNYLASINFSGEKARVLLRKVKEEISVPVPNTMMPASQLAQYGFGVGQRGAKVRRPS